MTNCWPLAIVDYISSGLLGSCIVAWGLLVIGLLHSALGTLSYWASYIVA